MKLGRGYDDVAIPTKESVYSLWEQDTDDEKSDFESDSDPPISQVASFPFEHRKFLEDKGLLGSQGLLEDQDTDDLRDIIYGDCGRSARFAVEKVVRAVEKRVYGKEEGFNALPRTYFSSVSQMPKNKGENQKLDGATQYYHTDEDILKCDREKKVRAKNPIFHVLVSRSGPLYLNTLCLTDVDEVRARFQDQSLSSYENRICVPAGWALVFLPWFWHGGILGPKYSVVEHFRLAHYSFPEYSKRSFGDVLFQTNWVSVQTTPNSNVTRFTATALALWRESAFPVSQQWSHGRKATHIHKTPTSLLT